MSAEDLTKLDPGSKVNYDIDKQNDIKDTNPKPLSQRLNNIRKAVYEKLFISMDSSYGGLIDMSSTNEQTALDIMNFFNNWFSINIERVFKLNSKLQEKEYRIYINFNNYNNYFSSYVINDLPNINTIIDNFDDIMDKSLIRTKEFKTSIELHKSKIIE